MLRALFIVVVVGVALYATARALVPDEHFDGDALLDLRTASNSDESNVSIHARLLSGMKFFHHVSMRREGPAIVLSVTGNLLLLAGFHFSPSFDITVEVPPDVAEIRVGQTGGSVWH